MEYQVVVWRGTLSDGSTCYAAICPAVRRVHGQGDTEDDALAEIADAIACFLELEPEMIKHGKAADDDLASLIADLEAEGVAPWVRPVAPVAAQTSAR